SAAGGLLPHQSRSYPSGGARLARTPSVSSQGSLDSSLSRQSQGSQRGSSPVIRTPLGGPDRSPSPVGARAASPCPSCPGPGPSPSPSPSPSLQQVQPQPRAGRCLSPLLLSAGPGTPPPSRDPPASPLGALQPDLYARRDGPLFLDARTRGRSLGRLHLRLHYDFDKSDLHIHLIEAHDLAGSEQGGFSDPYVRLSLVPPVDNRKRQTAIHRHDPNPFFNQHFKFPVSHQDLQEKTLVLQVFDYDRFSRNDVIGEVRMSMEDLDVTSSVEVWGEISKHKKPPEELQEVLLSLSYLPSAERLTVVLLKARNLFLPPDKDTVDPFVKVYLLNGGKRVKKKKTAARKSNCNPVWNEALTFNVASSILPQTAVEVCVMDQGNDLIGHTPLLGCCVIGPQEEGPEQDHWRDMTQSPRKAVAMWHTLR
ncbi:synaptotagmin-5, partial [Schistocerca piceifrons]|uniref:synaptotagmin-5 n=1 Tax=Schistocerca piceifrons TaxID=274613 RepID=UPI001F5F2B26